MREEARWAHSLDVAEARFNTGAESTARKPAAAPPG